ncbi:flagellar hook-associated protein FlgK [Thermosyntropha sp.]|uniref:flagellar hook-associated protein FlgK n=1 Tax=Thermosyntropha sp. TaxID=2740820 RepID=UPI0025F6D4F4|nr:flagellar hook-associated protein FlgK [Thermosyntropha sp.]MBO8159043.1 flagellar hook-associated protein FlgK [Thermosyntropha sp.]
MSFFGIEIGKRSIMSHQTALEVAGHNISNTNTPGYTRQVANLQTTRPYHTPVMVNSGKAGQMGTGVTVKDIQRIRDAFIDEQIRNENKTAGYWNALQDALSKIEVILNEPSEDGLRSVMDLYWKSWQDLVANPESEAVRATVVQRAMAMADTFNHTYKQLKELREDVNASVAIKVVEINSIIQQVADLNQQILAINIAGKQPNDLLDKRDYLLDQLSHLTSVKIVQEQNGMVAVQMGGRTLVQGVEYYELGTVQDTQGMHMVIWKDTGVRANVEGGELRGLLDVRGKTERAEEPSPSPYKEIVPEMMEQLNTLAKTIVLRTNELHRGGFSLNNQTTFPDGINFFDQPDTLADINAIEDWAEYIKVAQNIAVDPKNIAAAAYRTWDDSTGVLQKYNFGDGANALKIAQLKHSLNDRYVWAESPSLGSLSFPYDNISGDIVITYVDDPAAGTTVTKTINISALTPPANYRDLAELAYALQKYLQEDADLKANDVLIEVRLSGDKLIFVGGERFKEIDATGLNLLKGNPPISTPLMTASLVADKSYSGVINYVTCDDYWRAITANKGVQASEAKRMVDSQEILLNQLESKRQSVSGVSLDEEMANIIKFQHAYNAAARYITVMDESLEVIVNRIGIVGR